MLDAWIPARELPRNITPDLLHEASVDIAEALVPATGKEFGVIIDRLFRFAETFSIKDAGIREAMQFYAEALDDIPPNLLEKAVDSVIRNYKYGHRLPPPAELREVIEDEFIALINAGARIEMARLFGRYETPYDPPTDEDKAKVARILEETKRSLEAF